MPRFLCTVQLELVVVISSPALEWHPHVGCRPGFAGVLCRGWLQTHVWAKPLVPGDEHADWHAGGVATPTIGQGLNRERSPIVGAGRRRPPLWKPHTRPPPASPGAAFLAGAALLRLPPHSTALFKQLYTDHA